MRVTRAVAAPVVLALVLGCTTPSVIPTPLPATIQAMGDEYGCWEGGQYDFVAATIPRMWADADLVARVRVTEVRRDAMVLRVLHTYKGKAEAETIRIGMMLVVCLQLGVEYILFAEQTTFPDAQPGYRPPGAVGPQSIFRIDGDRIHAGEELGGGIGIENYDGMTVREFERLFAER